MAHLAIQGGEAVAADLQSRIPSWPQYEEADLHAVARVLQGGKWCRIYPDSWAEQFEEAWADYQDAQHCIATSNGTVSLQLALRACGVAYGDEVILPAVTFIATASAVTEIGAIPIFADIDPETGCLDADSVSQSITNRTRAVIGVHYGGYPLDFDRLLPLCQSHDISLIEDAAHAHGTEWRGRKVGAIGTVGSFSFQEGKPLTAGEGGAILTDDTDLFKQARLIHNIGRVVGEPGYRHYILSSNYRISELQAGLLIAQLKRLPQWTDHKAQNGIWLAEGLREIGGLVPLKKDSRITGRGHYYFVTRYQPEEFGGLSRGKFLQALKAEGVTAGIGFGMPLYHNPAFTGERLKQALGPLAERLPDYQELALPASEQFCRQQVIFAHPLLLAKREDLEMVVAAVAKIKQFADEVDQ